MKNKALGFGVFLISIGILWILFNFNIIDWSVFKSILTLWPLLIVMAGVNIIFGNNQYVKSISWILFLAIVISYGYVNKDKDISFFGNNGFIFSHDRNISNARTENVTLDKLKETKNGDLSLKLGGAKVEIGSENEKLIIANGNDTLLKHSINYMNNNEKVDLKFSNDKVNVMRANNHQNMELKINRDIIWDLDIDIGAASAIFDMSDLKIRNIDMDTGAVEIKMIFGSNYNNTQVKIDSGVSKYEVYVPEDSGIKVKFDGGLSKTNLNSSKWYKKDSYFYSQNYELVTNKIEFDVDMGVGEFNINIK